MRILRSNSQAAGPGRQRPELLHAARRHATSIRGTTTKRPPRYDYGTIIGQAGDLRPIYFALKANNLFATSFSRILDNATLAIDAVSRFR